MAAAELQEAAAVAWLKTRPDIRTFNPADERRLRLAFQVGFFEGTTWAFGEEGRAWLDKALDDGEEQASGI